MRSGEKQGWLVAPATTGQRVQVMAERRQTGREAPIVEPQDAVRILSEIATRLVRRRSDELDEGIHEALALIGAEVGADRTYVFQLSAASGRLTNTHEWCAPGIAPQQQDYQDVAEPLDGPLRRVLEQHEVISLAEPSEQANWPELHRAALRRRGTQAMLLVPMVASAQIVGLVGCDAVSAPRAWSPDTIALLSALSGILAGALQRREAIEELSRRQADERQFLSRLTDLHELVNELTRAPDLDTMFERAVVLARERLGFDRISFWLLAEDGTDRDVGTFGVDALGRLRDERQFCRAHPRDGRKRRVLDGELRRERFEQVELRDLDGTLLGRADLVIAQLWDGARVLGCLATDTLLSGASLSGRQLELISLFGDSLGHLVTLRRTQAALQQSVERLREQYQRLPLPTLTWRLSGGEPVLVNYNAAAAEYFREEPSDALGKTARELSGDRIDVLADIERCVRERGVVRCRATYRRRRPNEERLLEVTYAFVPPDLVICHVEDVTEGVGADEAIRQSELRYRAVVENQTDLICRFRADCVLTFVNEAYVRYFGRSAEELTGTSFLDLIPPAAREAVVKVLREATPERPTVAITHRVYSASGEIGWQHWVNHGLFNEFGQLVEFQSVGRDITEQRQAAEETRRAKDAAEQANRAKSEFLANISHEVRTPLSGIIGMTEQALEIVHDPEPRRYLEVVRSAGEWLGELLDGILDYSKIESGKLVLESIEFGLRDHIDGAVLALAPAAHDKGLELLARVAPEVPDTVKGDPARLRQVLANLTGNAIKFTAQGTVTVAVDLAEPLPGGARLRFTVSDTGIGIPPTQLDRIFQPFVQADASTSRRYGGAGLGLTIARQIVEWMQGTIAVESDCGSGTTFCVELPFETRGGGPRPAPPAALAGRRALVVEGHPGVRAVLSELLTSAELQVTATDSYRRAWEVLEAAEAAERPAVIVTAADLPDGDGVTLVERLRRIEGLDQLPALLLMDTRPARHVSRLPRSARVTRPVGERRLREALAASLDELPTEPAASTAAGPARRVRVLVVEDNPGTREMMEVMLSRKNYPCRTAADGREALDALAEERFDVVLMDVGLPGMDGLETTLRIRQRESGRGYRTPIIALTARALAGERERCLAAGMDGYLAKPFRPQALFEVIEQAAGGD